MAFGISKIEELSVFDLPPGEAPAVGTTEHREIFRDFPTCYVKNFEDPEIIVVDPAVWRRVLELCLMVVPMHKDRRVVQALSACDRHAREATGKHLKRDGFHEYIVRDLSNRDMYGHPCKSRISILHHRAGMETLSTILP